MPTRHHRIQVIRDAELDAALTVAAERLGESSTAKAVHDLAVVGARRLADRSRPDAEDLVRGADPAVLDWFAREVQARVARSLTPAALAGSPDVHAAVVDAVDAAAREVRTGLELIAAQERVDRADPGARTSDAAERRAFAEATRRA